jgi:hypothetical protein
VRVGKHLGVSGHFEHRLCLVDLVDRGTNRRDEIPRLGLGLHHQRHDLAGESTLGVWQIPGLLEVTPIDHILGHPDDGHPRIVFLVVTHFDLPAEWALTRPVSVGQPLADDHHRQTLFAILFAKAPALQEVDPHGAEVSGAHHPVIGDEPMAGIHRGATFDRVPGRHPGIVERMSRGQVDGGDTWQALHPVENVSKECDPLMIFGVLRLRQWTGSNEKHHRHGHLGYHQRAQQPAAATARQGATPLFEVVVKLQPGDPQGGNQAKADTHEQRDDKCEAEDPEIEAELLEEDTHPRQRTQSHQGTIAPEGQQQAGDTAHQTQNQTLGHELADQSYHAHRDLAALLERAGEKHGGHVGAGDEQEKGRSPHQDKQQFWLDVVGDVFS